MAKAKKAAAAAKKPKCEIGSVVCNGPGILRLEGVEPGDPKFRCCLGCWAWLKKMKIRFREQKSA